MTPASPGRVAVVGGGIFGVTAALELRRRGAHVTLFDAGTVPDPLAASTDLSKVVRMEYGADETYMSLMEDARDGWLAWNDEWSRSGGRALYHETGVLMVSQVSLANDGFERESYRLLTERGHEPERLDADALRARFPAWSTGNHVDGFFHAKGGYAESGAVVARLVQAARAGGVDIVEETRVDRVDDGPVVVTARGTCPVDHVVLAAGAWTNQLRPDLAESVRATGHPVFHLRPADRSLFEPGRFPTFTADVSRTGYYGFPVNADGIVKVANHGVGVRLDASMPREVPSLEAGRLERFLVETFPALVDAEVVGTRLCLYADTQDEDFWIAPDPDRPGVTIASGGSGHGFKFAPLLGEWIADAALGVENPVLRKFAWRPELRLDRGTEAARFHGDG